MLSFIVTVPVVVCVLGVHVLGAAQRTFCVLATASAEHVRVVARACVGDAMTAVAARSSVIASVSAARCLARVRFSTTKVLVRRRRTADVPVAVEGKMAAPSSEGMDRNVRRRAGKAPQAVLDSRRDIFRTGTPTETITGKARRPARLRNVVVRVGDDI
jgi:hypothetical protein